MVNASTVQRDERNTFAVFDVVESNSVDVVIHSR
jgi:hypothetical protein